jgi:hypothetical protein
MTPGLISIFSLLLVGAGAYCQAGFQSPRGGANVKLEITKIEPAPPLDPYRTISIFYSITNDSASPISIPDLNKLELEIRQESGSQAHRRTLPVPLSLAAIQARASAKASSPPSLPVEIEPHASHKGSFPTLDAWPPFPQGRVTIVLRLPLGPNNSIESLPKQPQVLEVSPTFQQRLVFGKAPFTDTRVQQELITFSRANGMRIVLLSTVYPGFLSVVADCIVPRQARVGLLHYWPQEEAGWMLAEYGTSTISIFRADKPGVLPVAALNLRDTLPWTGNSIPIGLIRVGRDEKKAGIDDYLLVTLKEEKGARFAIGEYWKRNMPGSTWSRAEIMRCAAGAGTPELRTSENGFEVQTGSAVCDIPLALKIADYRRLPQ